MDTIIIGGTFNPVHLGHIYLIDEVDKAFNPKKIILVPSYISSHKKNKPVESGEHRLEMLRLAVSNNKIIIENCEIIRKGISYSIDTVRELKERYNLTERPGFLIGDDLIEGFETWKKVDELALEVLLIVASRNKKDSETISYEHICLKNKIKEVSSSEIRSRLIMGKSCKQMLPQTVYDYIKKNNLYGVAP